MNDHIDAERLELYALRKLRRGIKELEEHLLLCAACRNSLDRTETFIRAMRQAEKVMRLRLLASGGRANCSHSGSRVRSAAS
jgi:hypothetical protein